MAKKNGPAEGNLLKEPLSLIDILGPNGASFEIKRNDDDFDAIINELNLGSDDDEESVNNKLKRGSLNSPWTKPFKELQQQMIQINEFIYKIIMKEGYDEVVSSNARVICRYNAYWEGEIEPFDSTDLHGSQFQFVTGESTVLPGIEDAVCTMRRGEESQFIISYHLLYGEMGCPPRIKKKSDALFVIELCSINKNKNVNVDLEITEQNRNTYAVVIDKVKQFHLKGKIYFQQSQYKNASRAFEKAVELLNRCRLKDDTEEAAQTEFLIKLNINLAICYNKLKSAGRACIVLKEVKRLTNYNPPCKALFQEGRALLMLGEYNRARKILKLAHKMDLNNQEIIAELKTLEELHSKIRQTEQEIWSEVTEIINSKKTDSLSTLSHFEEKMKVMIERFAKDTEKTTMTLPEGLSEEQLKIVNILVTKFEMVLIEGKPYSLEKVFK